MSSVDSDRKILIVGGAGFIGSNLAHWLLTNTTASVHVFDSLSRKNVHHNLSWLQTCPGSRSRLRVTVGDIRDYRAIERAVFAATEIYHFAAQVAVTISLEDPRTDFEVNAGGTLNILEAARRSGNRPFLLFTSTNKVYGHIRSAHLVRPALDHNRGNDTGAIRESQPLDFYSPYGCSKGTADQYVHDYARIFGIPTVVLRMSCVAGPRQFGTEDQGWVAHFVYSALQSRPITIYGDGRQVRDVLAVKDLLRAFSVAYEHRARTGGQVYNIGGGPDNTISLLGLVELIERVLNLRLNHRFRQQRPGDQAIYITNFGKFAKHTGWMPATSIEQTIHDIVRWYKSNEELFLSTPFPIAADQVSSGPIPEIAS